MSLLPRDSVVLNLPAVERGLKPFFSIYRLANDAADLIFVSQVDESPRSVPDMENLLAAVPGRKPTFPSLVTVLIGEDKDNADALARRLADVAKAPILLAYSLKDNLLARDELQELNQKVIQFYIANGAQERE